MLYMSPQEFANQCQLAMYMALNCPVHNFQGTIYGQSNLASPLLNGVLIYSSLESDPEVSVQAITKHYQEQKLPHSWWVPRNCETARLKKALQEKGVERLEAEFEAMYCSLESSLPLHTSIDVSKIRDEEEFFAWSRTLCTNFALPESLGEPYARLFLNLGFAGPLVHLGLKEGTEVVSTGSVLCSAAGAYLYNISTTERYRKRGYASLVAAALLEIARKKGARRAALFSSAGAASIYRRLGFTTATAYHLYLSSQ